jgi:hypothetical protein
MGKRVLAAFGVAAAMDGVLAAGLSAAPTSADAATSSPALPSTVTRPASASASAMYTAPPRAAHLDPVPVVHLAAR